MMADLIDCFKAILFFLLGFGIGYFIGDFNK